MAPGNMLNTGAARKGHSELKLILQHFDDSSHSTFSVCCKAIDNRPSNLQLHLSISEDWYARWLNSVVDILQGQLVHQELMPWRHLFLAVLLRQKEQELFLQQHEPPENIIDRLWLNIFTALPTEIVIEKSIAITIMKKQASLLLQKWHSFFKRRLCQNIILGLKKLSKWKLHPFCALQVTPE